MSEAVSPGERYGTRYPGLAAGWVLDWRSVVPARMVCDAPGGPVLAFEDSGLYQPPPNKNGRKSRRRNAARQIAMAAGEVRYWTGLPCKHGHIAERMTSDGGCCECARLRAVVVYWKDPEKARAKATADRLADPEKHRATQRKSYELHAERKQSEARDDHFENLDERLATSRAWKRDHSEQNLAITQGWRATHTTHIAEYNAWYKTKHALTIGEWTKWYRAENVEKHALYERNRRARKACVGGSHTIEDVQRILTWQNHQCVYCPVVLFRFHVDHIMPLVLGGSDGPENIQLLCPRCNMQKGPKHPGVFARLAGMVS